MEKSGDAIVGYNEYTPRGSDASVVPLFLHPYLFIGMREKGGQGKLLKLKPYGKKILSTTKEFDGYQPDFVSAYSYEHYAYFFLRENGFEQQKRKVNILSCDEE